MNLWMTTMIVDKESNIKPANFYSQIIFKDYNLFIIELKFCHKKIHFALIWCYCALKTVRSARANARSLPCRLRDGPGRAACADWPL